MSVSAAFRVFLMLIVVWVWGWTQYAWCATPAAPTPITGTLTITVRERSGCAGGRCSTNVKKFTMPVRIQPQPAKK